MKLRSDVTTVTVEGKLIVVARTMTEEFDAGEYLRRIDQLNANLAQLDGQRKEIIKVRELFSVKQEEAKPIAEADYEKGKAERAAAHKEKKEVEEPKE
tara:strand:+ start:1958 stop:2251 length:294 start_codon:yes stop_codon:yes gene_type:complete